MTPSSDRCYASKGSDDYAVYCHPQHQQIFLLGSERVVLVPLPKCSDSAHAGSTYFNKRRFIFIIFFPENSRLAIFFLIFFVCVERRKAASAASTPRCRTTRLSGDSSANDQRRDQDLRVASRIPIACVPVPGVPHQHEDHDASAETTRDNWRGVQIVEMPWPHFLDKREGHS